MRYSRLLVFLAYLLLAIIMTWPLAANLTTHIMGTGGDAPLFVWNAWWVKQVIFEGKSLFSTNYIFFPQTVSLVFHTLALFNSAIIAFLSVPLSLITSFNIYFLFSVALSGFSMFLLVDYLINNDQPKETNIPAFISGIIFAFSPYITVHWLGHQNLATVWFIPLFILFLIKTTQKQNWLFPIAAGIISGIASLNDFYNVIFVVIFFIIYAIWLIIAQRKKLDKNLILRFIVMIGFWLLVWSTWLIPALKEFGQSNIPIMSPEAITAFYSADLLRYVTPSFLNPFFGWIASIVPGRFSGGVEGTVFLGYIPLITTLICLTYLWRKKIITTVFPALSFWITTLLIFGLFSLGPYLKITERIIHLSLPYLWLYNLIGFWGNFRVPARFSLMVILVLAVLVGLLLNKLMKNQKVWLVLIASLIIIEFIPSPYPLMNLEVPPAYEIIENSTVDSVLDIPWGINSGYGDKGSFQSEFLFYGTYHEKKIATGSLSRVPNEYFEFYSDNSLLPVKTDMIVLHKNYLTENSLNKYKNQIINNHYLKVFEDLGEIVYKK